MRSRSEIENELKLITPGEGRRLLPLGIALMALGVLAAMFSGLTTMLSVLIVGLVLLVGGVFQIAYSFAAKNWRGFLLHLLVGVLYAAAGVMVMAHPLWGAVVLSTVVTVTLFISGIFRIVAALAWQFASWGWALASGAISVVISLYLFSIMPEVSLVLAGVMLGMDMIVFGGYLTAFALSLRHLSGREALPNN